MKREKKLKQINFNSLVVLKAMKVQELRSEVRRLFPTYELTVRRVSSKGAVYRSYKTKAMILAELARIVPKPKPRLGEDVIIETLQNIIARADDSMGPRDIIRRLERKVQHTFSPEDRETLVNAL